MIKDKDKNFTFLRNPLILANRWISNPPNCFKITSSLFSKISFA